MNKNSRNICQSLATKACLLFSNLLLQNSGFQKEDIVVLKNNFIEDYKNLPYFEILNGIINLNTTEIVSSKSVIYKGTQYKVQNYLSIIKTNEKRCFKILNIIIDHNRDVFLVCCEYKILYFDFHYSCYVVDLSTIVKDFDILNINIFTSPPIQLNTLIFTHLIFITQLLLLASYV